MRKFKMLLVISVLFSLMLLVACQNETNSSKTKETESSQKKVSDSSTEDTSDSVESTLKEETDSSEATTDDSSSESVTSSEPTVAVASSTSTSENSEAVETESEKSTTEPIASTTDKPVSELNNQTVDILTAFLEYKATQPNTTVDYSNLTMSYKGKNVPFTIIIGKNEGMIREVVVNSEEAHDTTLANYTIKDNTISINVTTPSGIETVHTKKIQ